MGASHSLRDQPHPQDTANANVMKNWHNHKRMDQFSRSMPALSGFTFRSSWDHDVKPSVEAAAATDMGPVWVSHMKAGATHVGRQLSGEVIEDAIYTGGIYFVLKDAVGGLVKVGVYGLPEADSHAAARSFAPGTYVTVREPYLKVGMDGFSFIRVDEPTSDIRLEQTKPSCNSAMWQEMGKQFFASAEHAAALECFDRAMPVATATNPIATLLTNRAAALLKAARPAEAARDCAVALMVQPSQVKAAGRLVEALSETQLNDAAAVYARGFVDHWPALKSVLQSYLRKGVAKDWKHAAEEMLWWGTKAISTVMFVRTTPETPSSTDQARGRASRMTAMIGSDPVRSKRRSQLTHVRLPASKAQTLLSNC
jgi:hypothetical protein